MTARCLLIMLAVLVCALARASDVIVLPDPTRPPNAVLNAMRNKAAGGQGAQSMAAPAAASDAASAASAPRPKPPLRVSSVRVSAGYGSVALLDGRLVQLGDKVGDATVAVIDDDGVVLRGPKGLQRLSLTPAANKTWPDSASPASGGGRKETR